MSIKCNDRRIQKRSRIIRWIITCSILVLVTVIAIIRQYAPDGKALPSVDALCPFGGLETIFSLVSGSGFVKHTALTSLVLLLGAIVITLLFRRSFCGQICPLGTLQRFFGVLGNRLFHKHFEIPRGIDRIARYLKYGVLVFFIVWTWRAASLVMRPYDPWAAYAHITSPQLFTEFGVGFVVLIVALAGSLMYERFFCKYLCPMGAFLGLFSKLSLFGIKRNADVCIECKSCDKICPMGISVSTTTKVNATECISCDECVNACPVAGALEIKAPGSRIVSATFMTTLVVVILAVIIGFGFASDAMGWDIPQITQGRSQGSGGGSSVVETENASTTEKTAVDVSYVKGSASMQDISSASGISKEQFIERWMVTDADFARPLKDIKDTYGFSVDDLKTWIAEETS